LIFWTGQEPEKGMQNKNPKNPHELRPVTSPTGNVT
jgi:hypothetical protein